MARLLTGILPDTITPTGDPAAAKAAWAQYRADSGRKSYGPLLTQPLDNQKLAKSGTPSYGLSLAPHSMSGYNVCRASTPGCRRGCVAYAGNGGYASVSEGRIMRTRFLAEHPEQFVTLLADEIGRAVAKHGAINVRLNTFSDLPWHELTPWLFTRFPDVQFYDYTKVWSRMGAAIPANWDLTYSASERTTDAAIGEAVAAGNNVAVVFSPGRTKPLPTFYAHSPVIDGDKSDDRALDARGVIVGLRAKGKMRQDIGKADSMVRSV